MHRLIDIAPSTTADLDTIFDIFQDIPGTIAIPPYFGDRQPTMPVASYYLNTMGSGALPLQFVRIPLDEYIPAFFGDVSFGGSDLPSLYEATKEFFDFNLTKSPTAMPTVSPTEKPTESPSVSPTAKPVTSLPTVQPSASNGTNVSPTHQPSISPTLAPIPSTPEPTPDQTEAPSSGRRTSVGILLSVASGSVFVCIAFLLL